MDEKAIKPRINLAEMVKDMPVGKPVRKPIPLRDAVVLYGFVHCCVCYRGGHTGTSLFTVFKDATGREKTKACAEHAAQFIKPKDVGKS